MSNRPDWTQRELTWIIVILAAALTVAIVLFKTGKIRLSQALCGLALLVWLLLVAGTTVLTRSPGKRILKLELFWSWKEAAARITNTALKSDRRYGLLIEIVLNMFLLFPAGFLIPLTMNRRVHFLWALLFGLVFSSAIEAAQYLTFRGFCELDDIFGNTLGCTVGCVIGNKVTGVTGEKNAKE